MTRFTHMLKKMAPVMVIFVLVLGALNVGSYDPYNELTILTPKSADATYFAGGLTIPALNLPTLYAPQLPELPTYSYSHDNNDSNDSDSSSHDSDGGYGDSHESDGYSNDSDSDNDYSHDNDNDSSDHDYGYGSNDNDDDKDDYSYGTSTHTGGYGTSTYSHTAETCKITTSAQTIASGSSVTVTWQTKGFTSVTLNGETLSELSGSKTFTNVQTNTTYTLMAKSADGKSKCSSKVTIACVPPTIAPTCTLTPVTKTIANGETVTLAWTTTNASTTSLSTFGTVAASGSQNTGALTENKNYTLTVLGTNGQSVSCHSNITVLPPVAHPVPRCDAFSASPATIQKGNAATLTWVTSNTDRVTINNGVGQVSATGTLSVSPLATTEYLLTAFGVNNQEHTCVTTVTVHDTPTPTAPACVAFTATPASLPVGGGNVSLAWNTNNASAVTISPTIGAVALTGSTTVALTSSQTFTLTASDAAGKNDVCTVAVPVTPPTPVALSCAANVTLSANAATITRGNSSVLSWTTTGVTGVSFDNGITATGLSGSTTVSPTTSTTYTLTATNGTETISCPVAVNVQTGGGGGGGSNAPRCELSASDNKIESGEKVVLSWESTRATELTLVDQTTDVKLITTEGLSSSAKDRLFDGEITVSPKKDTTYLLTVKRGNSTRKCTVDVDVQNNIVVTQVRDQQPLVSGISLTQVPYTGFEAGPILTLLFYTLLMAWALYVAYLIVIKRDNVGGMTLATPKLAPQNVRLIPESVRNDVFVAQVQVPEMPVSNIAHPANLPVAEPMVGYASTVVSPVASVVENIHHIDDAEMTTIENHAHAKRVLLSSDAIRHFIATTNSATERTEALDQVLMAAKAQFPAEDGWIVLNEKRMQDLCIVCQANSTQSSDAPYTPAVVPEGAGSLAEAIVAGNVVAAYELIGNRPMFALADAAADLDAVYRIRRGAKATASELLMKETAKFSDEQILKTIEALTGALDGTYTEEASAVKMSIMKAIKTVSL